LDESVGFSLEHHNEKNSTVYEVEFQQLAIFGLNKVESLIAPQTAHQGCRSLARTPQVAVSYL